METAAAAGVMVTVEIGTDQSKLAPSGLGGGGGGERQREREQ